MLIGGLATASWAIPITNTAGDAFEDQSNGTVFGYYQNSGQLLFTHNGNNLGNAATLAAVQQLARDELDNQSLLLTITSSVTYTSYDGNSGTWTTTPIGAGNTIDFYAVKAGNYFAMYEVNPADSTGSWSTFDIWNLGGPGTGGNGGITISHFTGYNPGTAPVPEPSTMLLLGTGLAGLAAYSFKRKTKN